MTCAPCKDSESSLCTLRIAKDLPLLHADSKDTDHLGVQVIMPPTSKKLQEHIGFGLSVHACIYLSKTVHARVLKFHVWIPHGKIVDTLFFFLSELSPFLKLCPFEKIKTKSDACHILWTVHARVLKFHIWIPRGKIADPYFFSCPSYLPFWSYAPLKKSEWNLVSKISRKVFELGAWNLVSW